MNLLSNAIKFTDRGYVKLTVTVIQQHLDKVNLKFSIEDTGIGISSDKLNRIFDSFEQAEDDTSNKYGGTGLGLTIVKKLVELKGGDLTVSSQIGKGSVFNFTNWFALSSEEVKPVPVEKPNVAQLPPFIDLKILIVEDNVVNQYLLSKILKDWQVIIDVVDNGRKAINLFKEKDFDLILMDTHMPELNGYETAKIIRMDFEEPKRSVPIISLSAASYEHEQQEAIAAGMNDVLPKPFQSKDLYQKIQNLLNIAVN